MWWRGQNLEGPRRDAEGRLWHFRVWHDFVEGRYLQRIFFWDDPRQDTGMAEFAGDQALHVTRLRQRISKLVSDPDYRRRFHRPLVFPVERHYGGGEPPAEAGDN